MMNTLSFIFQIIAFINTTKYGEVINITCPNGNIKPCYQGTYDCHNNSDTYCNKYLLGHNKTITCQKQPSMIIYNTTCPSGTKDCFNNSPVYC
jgi:hypothetical protein